MQKLFLCETDNVRCGLFSKDGTVTFDGLAEKKTDALTEIIAIVSP